MRWLRRFVAGLSAPFHRQRAEQELDDEIHAYVEAAAEQRMLAGSSREEAYRLARAEFGSVAAVKDYVRDAGWADSCCYERRDAYVDRASAQGNDCGAAEGQSHRR